MKTLLFSCAGFASALFLFAANSGRADVLPSRNAALVPGACAHSAAELAAISDRGRYLAEADQAGWHATDAVFALTTKDDPNIRMYIALKGKSWTVYFGKLNDSKTAFLVAFEATEGQDIKHFNAQKNLPPQSRAGRLLDFANGIETARSLFQPFDRPYNITVLSRDGGTFFVYIYPGGTDAKPLPLGGDERFLLSPDGKAVLERRRLHHSIIDYPRPDASAVSGIHTAILADVPEDTDVFFVFFRHPLIPEYVDAKSYLYLIDTQGNITCKGRIPPRQPANPP